MAVFLVMVGAGLFVPMEGRGTVFSFNDLVPGDKTVYLKDCNNDVSNNFVNGTLTVKMIGQSFNSCDVIIIVQSNHVGGSLEVIIKDNTLVAGSMFVIVNDNVQVGGRMLVSVKSNTIHNRDPHLFLDYNLNIEVNRNGRNGQDMRRNEVIAASLKIDVVGNWVKNRLKVESKTNFAGLDYKVFASGNTVNNFDVIVIGNKACRDYDTRFVKNTIDTKFQLNINTNKATRHGRINVDDNQVPYLSPMELDAKVEDNHAAKGDITITINENFNTNLIKGRIEKNGAGGDGRFSFRGNRANQRNEIHILENRVEKKREIIVTGNNPTPNPYVVKDNWACKFSVKPNLQPGATVSGNIKMCTQTLPPHSDVDGLSDAFERMIGTDPNSWDTDLDGLADGWADYGMDFTVDGQDGFGEIGNPLVPRGKSYQGAVDTLFNNPKEAPNCFCKDIYIEVDFMKKGPTKKVPGSKKKSSGGGPMPQSTTGAFREGVPLGGTFSLTDKPHMLTWGHVKPVVIMFLKRGVRLHVDLGWPMGSARGNAFGGGEWLRHNTTLRFSFTNDTVFDFYNYKNGEVRADYDKNRIREPRHFSTNRKGSFRYLIMGHNYTENPLSSGIAEGPGDDLFISHGQHIGQGWSKAGINIALSYTFCHELGHNLNLGLSPGTHENAPAGYWSCMSYNSTVAFTYVGFSEGVKGTFNDWHSMDAQIGIAQWWTHDYSK